MVSIHNNEENYTAAAMPSGPQAGASAELQVRLSVSVEGGTDDEIADITHEMSAWIRDAGPSCEVAPVTASGSGNEKGLLTVLGALGLKFLEPGALKALIDCLAVYIKERRRQVTVTVQVASGTTVKIDAGGIGRGELEMLLREAGQLLGSPGALPHA